MAAEDAQNQVAIIVDVMDFGFGWCNASEHHCIVRRSSDRVTTTTATTAELCTNKFEVRFFQESMQMDACYCLHSHDGLMQLSSLHRQRGSAHTEVEALWTKSKGELPGRSQCRNGLHLFNSFPSVFANLWLQYTVLE